MGALGQSIHDDPNRIYSSCRSWELRDKVYRNIFPFPQWDIQRLHLAVRPLVLRLNLPAGQASFHIPGDIPLHAGPPIVGSKIPIHLRCPWWMEIETYEPRPSALSVLCPSTTPRPSHEGSTILGCHNRKKLLGPQSSHTSASPPSGPRPVPL